MELAVVTVPGAAITGCPATPTAPCKKFKRLFSLAKLQST